MCAQRYVMVRVPDWQTVSLELAVPPGASAAVVSGGRIRHASLRARSDGVEVGMKVSTAQVLSPHMILMPEDIHSDAQRFNMVMCAVHTQIARVYGLYPGMAWALVDGGVRWHGSESAVAEAIIDAVNEHVGLECQVGIATGVLAAVVAAYRGDIVAADNSAQYVAALPLSWVISCVPEWESALGELVGELELLGISRCADLNAERGKYYRAHFGAAFDYLMNLVSGGDVFLPMLDHREYDIRAHYDCEDAQISSDFLMIPMRHLAFEVSQKMLHARLRARSMLTVIGTADGEQHRREWGEIPPDKPDVVARRLRWHMNSLVSGVTHTEGEDSPIGGGVSFLEVRIRECEPADPDTPLWGGYRESEAVPHCVERLHSFLGEGSVFAVYPRGSYDPRSRVDTVQWRQEKLTVPTSEKERVGAVSELPEILCTPPMPVGLRVADSASQEQCAHKDLQLLYDTIAEGSRIIPFPGMEERQRHIGHVEPAR